MIWYTARSLLLPLLQRCLLHMPYTARHPISDMTCMTQKADAALPLH